MKLPAWITTAFTALVAALLPACDAVNLQEIKPGLTTAAEVRARMGEPGFQHWNNDGTATWEYSRQPSGVQCYMITFGSDQIVKTMEQVLNDTNYAKVRAQDRNGEWFEAEGEELIARCFCHELDHLDGIVYTEVMERFLTEEELEQEK